MMTSIYANRLSRPPVARAMREAIAVGRWAWRGGCAVALLALLMDVYIWSSPLRVTQFVVLPLGLDGQVTISPGVQTVGFVLALIPFAVGCYALLQVRRISQALSSLAVFGEPLVQPLRRFAFALLVLALCDVVVRTGNSILLTHFNPPGQQHIAIGLSSDTLLHVVIALLLLALTDVLREAAALEAEYQQIV